MPLYDKDWPMTTAIKACCCALLLVGCASRAPVIIDSACERFAILHPSRQDTMETQRQILVHNRVWRAACAGEKAAP